MFFFFFQAEDGIRYLTVTGVQTCALPILTLAGLPIQYVAHWVRKLPRRAQQGAVAFVRLLTELRRGKPVLPRPAHGPLDEIPIIGFHLVDAIAQGLIDVRVGVAELTAEGARFTDGTAGRLPAVITAPRTSRGP